MEELAPQNDGLYAVCFRNFKKISREEVEDIFTKYGDVCSIRQSTEPIPWMFIRYKHKEEAQGALDDLRDCKDLELRVAKSNIKKRQEQEGDWEKDSHSTENLRENRSFKGSQNKNWSSDRCRVDVEDDISHDIKSSIKKAPSSNSRYQKMGDLRYSGGREEADNFRRSTNSSPPQLVKKSPGNHIANAQMPQPRRSENDLPKLVKGSDYYASANQATSIDGLACKAAYTEVWENHPLYSESQLWEVILTNFNELPSKKEIYDLCSGIRLLHVSFGETYPRQYPFCRVLVTSEEDLEKLYGLSSLEFKGSELIVTSLEDLLDGLWDDDNT